MSFLCVRSTPGSSGGGGGGTPGPAPAGIWPGFSSSSQLCFGWWPPTGVVPTYYNVYRDGTLLYSGVTPQNGIGGGTAQPYYVDINLAANATHQYYVTAVVGGVESLPSTTLTLTTLVGATSGTGSTPTTPPAAPVDPATWLQNYALPTGNVWTATITTETSSSGTAGTGSSGTATNNVGCSPQYAFKNCQAGDVIVLTAGATYTSGVGNQGWILPNVSGPGWVYIVSSQDPGYNSSGTLMPYSYSQVPGAGAAYQYGGGATGAGNFVNPGTLSSMATMQFGSPTNSGVGLIMPAGGVSKIRFVGINIQPAANQSPQMYYCVEMLQSGVGNLVPSCDSIYFDRCMFGNDTSTLGAGFSWVRHGIGVNCNHMYIGQCYFRGFADDTGAGGKGGADANAIFIPGGGWHLYQNNYIEAVAEGIIYGGQFVDQTQVAHDVVYRYNFCTKPLAWQSQIFSDSTKNHFELKMGQRVECYGNVHQWDYFGSASEGQYGRSYVIGARDQNASNGLPITSCCPWIYVSDVNIHDNFIWGVGSAMYVFSEDHSYTAYTARIKFQNNMCWINPVLPQDGSQNQGWGIGVQGPVSDVIIDHNTIIIDPQYVINSGNYTTGIYNYNGATTGTPYTPNGFPRQSDRWTITNNIFDGNRAVSGDSLGAGLTSITTAFTNYTWNCNLTINDSATTYPATTYAHIPYASVGFASFTNNQTQPNPASNWDVTTGAYSTGSTTGGPVGAGSPLTITTTSLPNATVGSAYSHSLAASGGTGNYTWSKVSAKPNTALAWTVSPAGAVQATPQGAETVTLVAQVNDGVSSAQVTLTVTAVASGSLAVVTSSMPNATSGAPYAVQAIASGGVPPYRWTSSWTASPYVDVSGLVHAVLTSAPASGTLTVTDSAGATATSGSLSITVDSVLRVAGVDNVDGFLRLPSARAGHQYGSYSPQVQAFGGTGPYTYAVTSGALPPGLSMASTGAISGTPTIAGAGTGTITVTDSATPTANVTNVNFLLNVMNQNQIARPSYNTGTGFFVGPDGTLRDPGGFLFIPRGWNRDHYDQAPTGMQLTHPSGCKAGTYKIDGSIAVSTYTSDIVNNMQAYYNLPLYPIFYTTGGAQTTGDSSLTDLAGCVAYWCNNMAAYVAAAGNNWIPGVANEWGPAGKAASSTWLNAHLPVIQPIASISGAVITLPSSVTGTTNPYANCPFAWIGGNTLSGVSPQMVNISSTGGTPGAWQITASASIGTATGGTLGGGSVGAMRVAGCTLPIKVDAGNYGQSAADLLTYAAQIQAADPQQNVLFDLHLYDYFMPTNCQITSVAQSGGNTILTLDSSATVHPFYNTPATFYPEVSVTLQGMAGGTWASVNGQSYAVSSSNFGGSTGAWTVTIPLNSSGLGTYTASSGRVLDSYNPIVLAQTFATLAASSGVCVYFGEFGPYNNGDYQVLSPFDVIQGAEANGIGWCYWAWDDNTAPENTVTSFNMIQNTPPAAYSSPASLAPAGQGLVFHPRMSCNALASAAPIFL